MTAKTGVDLLLALRSTGMDIEANALAGLLGSVSAYLYAVEKHGHSRAEINRRLISQSASCVREAAAICGVAL